MSTRAIDDLVRAASDLLGASDPPRAEPSLPGAGTGRPDGSTRLVAEPAWDAASPTLIVRKLSEVTPKPIDWLWPRWLAKGKLHILGGHAGDGKSTLTADLAAICSRAGTFPDGAPAPLARWLFLLAEDALDDTLRPRLDALGAEVDHIFAVEASLDPDGQARLFNLYKDLAGLEATIAEQQIDVVVIDPVTSFMPNRDRNAEGDVRDILTPLGKLAERTGAAVLAIMHVGKPNGTARRPVQQLLGATAFGAIARLVWMVAPAPEDETGTRRVLGVVKSNLAMKPTPLEWSRAEDGPIVWHGASRHAMDELFGANGASPRADAEGFLRETLRGGSKPTTEVFALGKLAGLTEKTLRRAFEQIGGEAYKTPHVKNGPWCWRLPNDAATATATRGDAAASEAAGWRSPAEKMATAEDAQVAIFSSDHLLDADASADPWADAPDGDEDGIAWDVA